MSRYWLGVTGNVSRFSDKENSWWCMPREAKKDDKILMYASRRPNTKKYHGVFAIFVVSDDPDDEHPKNHMCQPYGKNTPLRYTLIHRQKEYQTSISPSEIKNNKHLQYSNIVRLNFQGTTFPLTEKIYTALVDQLEKKNIEPE